MKINFSIPISELIWQIYFLIFLHTHILQRQSADDTHADQLEDRIIYNGNGMIKKCFK